MTVIMPMGGKKFGWEPGKKQTVKVASAGKENEQEIVVDGSDALYEAAKAHLGKQAQFEDAEIVTVEEIPGDDMASEIGGIVNEVSEEVTDDAVEESLENAEEKSEAGAATEIGAAVEKIEEAVEEVKEAVEELDGAGAGEEVEVEIELDDLGEKSPFGEAPCADESCEDDLGEDEIVIESKDEKKDGVCEACGAVTASCECKAKKQASVSSGDEYVRYSKVSPKNQRLVRNYWKSDLGYDPDYVALMTKNYEK